MKKKNLVKKAIALLKGIECPIVINNDDNNSEIIAGNTFFGWKHSYVFIYPKNAKKETFEHLNKKAVRKIIKIAEKINASRKH